MRASDYAGMTSLAAELFADAEWRSPWRSVVAHVGAAFPGALVLMTDADLPAGKGRLLTHWPTEVAGEWLRGLHSRQIELRHPLARHFATATEKAPVSAGLLLGSRWRRTESFALARDAFGAIDSYGLAVRSVAGVVRGLVIDIPAIHERRALPYLTAIQPLLCGIDEHDRLIRGWRGDGKAVADDHTLTTREIAVLLLLADTLPAATIARRLRISVRTVHKHVERIYRKLGVRDRLGAVLRAQSMGILRQNARSPSRQCQDQERACRTDSRRS
ncbi:helix-turn-helix transcriptional regulator [Fodinicola acaciae]|uniref:helix-turn-helix transcriptional regulator n=1 Tax=Fodinicola acaciae TaxID=2681555 RepID=UPI0013D71492|nr:LuxR C-terminal-related transcriptional regulator [Fodinicola acaciae]